MRSSAPSPGIAPTAISPDPAIAALTIVAATRLEARAVRRACPAARVVRTGMALSCVDASSLGGVVVSCGLAGSLRADLCTGAILVPHTVRRPNGETFTCDPELVRALEDAARRLGYEPEPGALLTSTTLITGDARRSWRERGYVAADMETGLIAAPRVAAVRVVLDSPERELSGAWLTPARALLRPSAWRELPWLWRTAPRCARRAAQVLAAARRAVDRPQ